MRAEEEKGLAPIASEDVREPPESSNDRRRDNDGR